MRRCWKLPLTSDGAGRRASRDVVTRSTRAGTGAWCARSRSSGGSPVSTEARAFIGPGVRLVLRTTETAMCVDRCVLVTWTIAVGATGGLTAASKNVSVSAALSRRRSRCTVSMWAGGVQCVCHRPRATGAGFSSTKLADHRFHQVRTQRHVCLIAGRRSSRMSKRPRRSGSRFAMRSVLPPVPDGRMRAA